jgi:hypothetical protein
MENPDLDYMIMTARRNEDLRTAEHSRLVNEALQAQTPARMNRPLRLVIAALAGSMAYLGERMLAWSRELQCRYQIAIGRVQPCP